MTEQRPVTYTITGFPQPEEPSKHICLGATLEVVDALGKHHFLNPASPFLTREVAKPEGYPPVPGDVWRHVRQGSLWFTRQFSDGIRLVAADSANGIVVQDATDPSEWESLFESLELVFRYGERP